jgi:hypothetical protein
MVALSPVVPHGTKADEPDSICQSTSARNASSSIAPSRIGVTRAGIDPLNILFPFTFRIRIAILGA